MADDWSVVNAARVSFNRQRKTSGPTMDVHLIEPTFGDAEAGLIKFLMKNRHGTPFEHNAFRFHIKCPIFVAREWMRHRIGSFNEWSGRYSKLEPEFYIPNDERITTQVGKPGHYKFEPLEPPIYRRLFREALRNVTRIAWTEYEIALEKGVSKELARMFLPVNIYTQFYWTINARSLMNFLSLRNAEQAMFEIRQYAIAVEEFFAQAMPITAQAFIENERTAP